MTRARRVVRMVLPVLLLFALAAGSVWLARIWLAQQFVAAALDSMGLSPASVVVSDIRPDRIELRNIRLGADDGPGLAVEHVVVRASGLTVASVDAHDVALTVRLIDGAVDLGPLDVLFDGDGGSGDGRMPDLPRVTLHGLMARIASADLEARVELPGTVTLSDSLVTASSAILFTGTGVSGDGQVRSRTGLDGATALTLALDALEVGPPWLPAPVRFDGTGLSADLQPGFIASDIALRLGGTTNRADIRLVAAGPFATPTVELSLDLLSDDIASLRQLAGGLALPAGTARLALGLSGMIDLAALTSGGRPRPGASTASGSFDLAVGIADSPLVGSAALGAAGTLRLEHGVLSGSVPSLGLDLEQIPPGLVPPDLATAGVVALVGPVARLRGSDLSFAASFEKQDIEMKGLFDIDSIAAGTIRLDSLRAQAGGASVSGSAQLQLPRALAGAARLTGIRASMPFAVSVADGALRMTADSGSVQVAALSIEDVFVAGGPVGMELGALALAVAADGAISGHATVTAGPLRGSLVPLSADLSLDGAGVDVRLDGATGTVSADLNGLAIAGRGRIGSARLSGPFDPGRQSAHLAWRLDSIRAAPGSGLDAIDATLEGDLRLARGRIDLTGRAGLAGVPGFRLDMVADGDLAGPAGNARFTLGRLALAELQPRFATLVDGQLDGIVSGTVALSLGRGLTGAFGIDLLNVGLAGSELGVFGVSGELALDRLDPPGTDRSRTIRLDRVSAGTDITGIEMTYRVVQAAGQPALSVESLDGAILGGRFALRPLLLVAQADSRDAVLDLSGIDLAELGRLIGVEGVELEGTVSGAVPVRLVGADGIAATGVKLTSDGPGVVRVAGTVTRDVLGGTGREEVDLVIRVLEDFHFTSLTLGVEKALDGQAEMRVAISGANPAVLDSHPVDLNINVSGNADRLFQTILTVYRASSGAVDHVVRALR